MCMNLEQEIYRQICALFTLYIQLYRKIYMYLLSTWEREAIIRDGELITGMNYRTQVIIPVLAV